MNGHNIKIETSNIIFYTVYNIVILRAGCIKDQPVNYGNDPVTI